MATDDKSGEEKSHPRLGEMDGYTVQVDDLADAPAEELAEVLKRRSQKNRRRRCARRVAGPAA